MVTVWFGPRDSVSWMVRHAHAEAIGLQAMIAAAVRFRSFGIDKRQQSTAAIAGDDKRVHATHELVMNRQLRLHAAQCFAV